jgi:hypothetical protein
MPAQDDFRFAIEALEDLTSGQYLAVDLADGKLANNAEEASGIILNKPDNTEHIAVAYAGKIRYKAGGAITKGDKLTVTTSGFFTTAGSGDSAVGEAYESITSGSNGLGLFSFANVQGYQDEFTYSVTAADAITAGKGYAIVDNKLANNGAECNGISPAISSGDAGRIVVMGITEATFADSYGPGQDLMCTTSGYFTAVTSGFSPNARSLAGATSGSNGAVVFGIGAGDVLS